MANPPPVLSIKSEITSCFEGPYREYLYGFCPMSTESFTINPGITKIDYNTARFLIESGKCLLIDVREAEEYSEGYIPPAVNLSVNDMTLENTKKIAPDFAKPIIIYCRTGRRTRDAARKLKGMGYYYILDMGGISNWPYQREIPPHNS